MKKNNLNRAISSVENLIANLDYNVTVAKQENVEITKKINKRAYYINKAMLFVKKIYKKVMDKLQDLLDVHYYKNARVIKANEVSIVKATALSKNLAKLFEE